MSSGGSLYGRIGATHRCLGAHVSRTYWDDLGWPDRFGLPEAMQRQGAYSQMLGLSSVFTPQTVIDGRRSFMGSDRNAIGQELTLPRDGPPIVLTLHNGAVTIGLRGSHAASGDVLLVAYRHSAVTSIGRGESSGRTINEANIVRSIRTLGRWQGQDTEFSVPIDSLPHDATDVAVLIQSQSQGSIIGAATLSFPAENRVARSSGGQGTATDSRSQLGGPSAGIQGPGRGAPGR